MDEALPADADARAERLASVERELADVWAAIYAKVEAGDPRAFKCCDRKWCFCHAGGGVLDARRGAPIVEFSSARVDVAPQVARPLCFPCADQGDPVADAGDDLDALPVRDLRALCKARGLDTVVPRGSDSRETLVERLRKAGG